MSEASATTGTAADPGLQQQASTIASADEDAVNASTSIDYLDLCRLCLQKDSVNLSIFEEEGEQRQMFLKISATLPVKIFKEDKLPKKICDDCSYKVELLYQFWNTAATSEKQLLQWLGEIGLDDKQNYEVLEEDLMKSEKGNDNRLNTNIIQVSDQNSIEISMIDNISLITIPAGSEQFTTVPIDASGTIQTEAMQSSHDQSQIEEDRSEMGDMSDDGCDNEGLPVKEESDDQNNQANMDQAYVSIEAGPSGIQHQKISELTIQQAADGDPKTGVVLDHEYKLKDEKMEYLEVHEYQELVEPAGGGVEMTLAVQQDETVEALEKKLAYGEQLQDQNCMSSFSAVEDELEEDEEKVEGLPDDIHIQEYEDVDAGPMKASGNNLFFGITEPQSPEAQNMENEDELDYENNSNSANGHSRSEPIRSILVKLDSGVIKRLYRCNHCDQVFDSVRHCVKHMTTNHQTNRKYRVAYRCKTCGKLFRTKYGCENHIQGKHKNRTIRCRYCDFETSSVTYIKKHERNHLDDFEIRCDLCNKGFASKTVLERHMISHTGEKPFVCEKCNASYADKRSLTLHMTVHDPEGRPKRYTCDQCDYSSFWKNAVKTHMKVHTGAKVICDECGQAVASNYYLKIHKRIHSDEKPFTCDVCAKGFRQMKNLVVHRRTHTKVKPYKCHACEKSFSQNVWLKKHKCRSNSAAGNHVEVGNEVEMAEAEIDMDPDNIESINDNFQ